MNKLLLLKNIGKRVKIIIPISQYPISDPENYVYDGSEHKYVPTISDIDGNVLQEGVVHNGVSYAVSYSTSDMTNVTGEIECNIIFTISNTNLYQFDITEDNTYTVTKTWQIIPAEMLLQVGSNHKVVGQADPIINWSLSGQVKGEIPGHSGDISRVPGEYQGNYDYTIGDFTLADNPDGNFLAQNYVLLQDLGSLTIVPNPIVPDDPNTPEPTDPDRPVVPDPDQHL